MGMQDFAEIMLNVYRVCLYGGVGIGIILYRQSNAYFRWLTVYLCLMLFIELGALVVGKILKNNHIILPLYSLIELVFFLLFYKKYFLGNQFSHFKKAGAVAILFILGEIVWNFVLHSPNARTFQPYSKVVDNAVVIAMALTSLYNSMASTPQGQNGNVMFNLVMLMFFTFNTMFFLPFNFLVNAPMESKFLFWAFHTISLIAFYTYIDVRIVTGVIRRVAENRA